MQQRAWEAAQTRRARGDAGRSLARPRPAVIFIPCSQVYRGCFVSFCSALGHNRKMCLGNFSTCRVMGEVRSLLLGERQKKKGGNQISFSRQLTSTCLMLSGARLQRDTSSSLSPCQAEYVPYTLYMWEVVAASPANRSFKTYYNGTIVWD